MARKYELINDLYDQIIVDVTKDARAWQSFLRTACRNYKLRFDEQLLLFAQRPDATAVLEIERWNTATEVQKASQYLRILRAKAKNLNTTLTSPIHTEQNGQEKFRYGKCLTNIKAMLRKH